MKEIKIDRHKMLRDDEQTGHNRWHPDIEPKIAVEPGEEVYLETRDASDGQVKPGMLAVDLSNLNKTVVHPLTGPVFVNGAKPGDLLEIEYLEILPQSYGYTHLQPGNGFLRDLFTDYYLVHWDLGQQWATSPQLPSVRIPNGSFMGTAGLSPSKAQVSNWKQREFDLCHRAGVTTAPSFEGAIPSEEPIASEGLRTLPPRENGGNIDIKQLTKGSKLMIPVNVEGALFSVGDAHYAQGDSECCDTAIEMAASVVVRFRILKGQAKAQNIQWPRFTHSNYFGAPESSTPKTFIATMGVPVSRDGAQKGESVTLAARNALLNMIDLLQERGWSQEQAYVICSVAVDLKISNLVNLPNVTVSAFLPEAIFSNT